MIPKRIVNFGPSVPSEKYFFVRRSVTFSTVFVNAFFEFCFYAFLDHSRKFGFQYFHKIQL